MPCVHTLKNRSLEMTIRARWVNEKTTDDYVVVDCKTQSTVQKYSQHSRYRASMIHVEHRCSIIILKIVLKIFFPFINLINVATTNVDMVLRKERDKQILRDLRQDVQEHQSQIRESKAIARAWRNEALQKEEDLRTGGTLLVLGGLAVAVLGGGVGAIAQRYLMSTNFSDTIKAPAKIPLVTLVSWPIAVGTAFVPHRLGKAVLTGFFGGMGGGGIIGKFVSTSIDSGVSDAR